jgi:hypothetical protein
MVQSCRVGGENKQQIKLETEVDKEHLEIILRFIYTDTIDVANISGLPASGTYVRQIRSPTERMSQATHSHALMSDSECCNLNCDHLNDSAQLRHLCVV